MAAAEQIEPDYGLNIPGLCGIGLDRRSVPSIGHTD
jgi:hypothetical protein